MGGSCCSQEIEFDGDINTINPRLRKQKRHFKSIPSESILSCSESEIVHEDNGGTPIVIKEVLCLSKEESKENTRRDSESEVNQNITDISVKEIVKKKWFAMYIFEVTQPSKFVLRYSSLGSLENLFERRRRRSCDLKRSTSENQLEPEKQRLLERIDLLA